MTLTVSRQEIDDLKARVHLTELFQHHGVEIRKQGRGIKALCPFHEEKTPSLSIDPPGRSPAPTGLPPLVKCPLAE